MLQIYIWGRDAQNECIELMTGRWLSEFIEMICLCPSLICGTDNLEPFVLQEIRRPNKYNFPITFL